MSHPPDPIARERMHEAMATLRKLEREVLILSAERSLGNRAIAARLGITPDRAERILASALRKLDRAVERQERSWWRIW